MTDYNKLAQRIVALGVGKKLDDLYYSWGLRAKDFCNDGRVVLALMEKCHAVTVLSERGLFLAQAWATEDSDVAAMKDSAQSRALVIVTACLDALEEQKHD